MIVYTGHNEFDFVYRAINAYIKHENESIKRKRRILSHPKFKPYHHAHKELTP